MFISRRRFLASSSALATTASATPFFPWRQDEDEEAPLLERNRGIGQSGSDGNQMAQEDTYVATEATALDITQQDDIGCSAMVGLALLADGSTPNKGENRRQLQDITRYLLEKVRNMPKGNITSKTGTQLQNKIGSQAHSFFALLYLSQVIGEINLNDATLAAATKLKDTVVAAQTP